MSFTRASAEQWQAANLESATEVDQGARKTEFISSEGIPCLYTTGLNPCIGIVFYGEFQEEGSPQAKKFFSLSHYEGLTKKQVSGVQQQESEDKKEEKIKEACKDEIIKTLSEIEESYSDIGTIEESTKLILKKSYVFYCTQNEEITETGEKDRAWRQNKTFFAVKNILDQKNITSITDFVKGKDITSSVSCSSDYEGPEVYEEKEKENHSMDIFIRFNDDELEKIYCYAPPKSPSDGETDEKELGEKENNENELDKDKKENTEKPSAKRKLEPSSSSSSSSSQSSSFSYEDSSSTLFSTHSSSLQSSSNISQLPPTNKSTPEDEPTTTKKLRPGS